jgi:hypothetical protein
MISKLPRVLWGNCLLGLVVLASLPAQTPTAPPTSEQTAYPKDHPGQLFPDLKIYDDHGSPIRVPKEDWEGAKARIAADPEWAKWMANRQSQVDDWMAKRSDKVEWVAGYWHDFISPKDGSRLAFTPDEPGPETLHSPSDPKVLLTPKLHAAWIGIFRQNHASKMIEAAQLYRLTGDKKYADWAASQLDFYADNYLKWDLRPSAGGQARLTYQTLDEANLLIAYVNTARLLGDYVTPEQKQKWITELFKPETVLLQGNFHMIMNIACWQRSAVAQAALYSGDEELWKEAVDGPNGIRDQVARGVTSDYIWREQSLGYNAYVVQALYSFFYYAQIAGRGAELETEMETIENLMLAPTMMRFPTGQLPNPADSTTILHAPDLSLLAQTAQVFPTKLGNHEFLTTKSWAALLDPPATDAKPSDLPPTVSWNMASSHMAIIRSGAWQVFFHYGQLVPWHAQQEALNYEAFFNNTDVTHDPGTVSYGSPMSAQYYDTGLCANVPLVDGLGQESWQPGQLDSFADASVNASQPHYRSNATANRTLTIDGSNLNDLEHIATTDGVQHALGFVLHLQGKVKLPDGFVSDPNFTAYHSVPGFKFLTNAVSAKFHDQAAFDVDYNGTLLHVTFALPGDFTVWYASAPDVPPHRNDMLYLETQGTDATLKTTFTPAK